MHFPDLERDIDTALRALPAPTAPPALTARVMQGVREAQDAQALPEARGGVRPWFKWGPSVQVSAALVFVAGGAALTWFSRTIAAWAQSLDATAPVAASRVVWHAIEPAVAGGAVYVLVMGVVVACIAAALSHVALEGTSN